MCPSPDKSPGHGHWSLVKQSYRRVVEWQGSDTAFDLSICCQSADILHHSRVRFDNTPAAVVLMYIKL